MPVARDFGDSQKKILINIDQYRSNKLYKLVEIREKNAFKSRPSSAFDLILSVFRCQ